MSPASTSRTRACMSALLFSRPWSSCLPSSKSLESVRQAIGLPSAPAKTWRGSPDAAIRRRLERPDARGFQRFHDVRLVRAPERAVGEALVDRRARQLGHRALRVPAAGAGEPHRLHADVLAAAQDHAGSDYSYRLRTLCGALHEAACEARLPVGMPLHGGGGVLRLPWIRSAIWCWKDR